MTRAIFTLTVRGKIKLKVTLGNEEWSSTEIFAKQDWNQQLRAIKPQVFSSLTCAFFATLLQYSWDCIVPSPWKGLSRLKRVTLHRVPLGLKVTWPVSGFLKVLRWSASLQNTKDQVKAKTKQSINSRMLNNIFNSVLVTVTLWVTWLSPYHQCLGERDNKAPSIRSSSTFEGDPKWCCQGPLLLLLPRDPEAILGLK